MKSSVQETAHLDDIFRDIQDNDAKSTTMNF